MKRPLPGWFRALRPAVAAAALSLLLLWGFTMFFEDRLIYFPSREGDWEALQRLSVPHEEVEVRTPDGVTLHGWFAPNPAASVTILYFHGNAGNLSDRADWVAALVQLPASVFIIDYRGYGKSGGTPDEAGLYVDAEAAFRWLVDTRATPPERIVLYGKSLGGAVACDLATRVPCGGLILQSTFTNAKEMSRIMMPAVPASWFLRSRFDTLDKIRRVSAPKLILHSRADEIIPFEMAERLQAAAPEPKTFVPFERSGHNGLIDEQRKEVLEVFRRFLQSSVKK